MYILKALYMQQKLEGSNELTVLQFCDGLICWSQTGRVCTYKSASSQCGCVEAAREGGVPAAHTQTARSNTSAASKNKRWLRERMRVTPERHSNSQSSSLPLLAPCCGHDEGTDSTTHYLPRLFILSLPHHDALTGNNTAPLRITHDQ